MRRAPLAALLLLGACLSAEAFGRGEKGASGAQFLRLAPGARPAAMGGAFGAVDGDAHAVYYNPAGLGSLEQVELVGMRNSHIQGLSHNFGALAVPMLSWIDTRRKRSEWGTLAFSLTSLSVDGLERRGTTETDEPAGTFGATDLAYTLGYGLAPGGPLSAGASVKMIHQTLDSSAAAALALDAGALWRRGKWKAAGGFRNFGTQPRFRSESDPLPFVAYAAGAGEAVPGWLLAAELRFPRDDAPRLCLGTETRRAFSRDLAGALRAGYTLETTDAEGLGGFTAGAGVEYRGLGVDFAWVPYGELGTSFRYSLLFRF